MTAENKGTSIIRKLHGGPVSITGHPLREMSALRMIFMDESGRNADQPVTVVASVIIDPDRHMRAVDEALQELRDAFVPEGIRDGFIMHAADLYREIAFGSERDPRCKELLYQILMLPHRLRVPIAIGFCRKYDFEPGMSSRSRVRMQHIMSYSQNLQACDEYLSETSDGEVATVTVESIPEMKELLDAVHGVFAVSSRYPGPLRPLRCIRGRPAYMEKDAEPSLQIADAYAWLARRILSGHRDVEGLARMAGLSHLIGTNHHGGRCVVESQYMLSEFSTSLSYSV